MRIDVEKKRTFFSVNFRVKLAIMDCIRPRVDVNFHRFSDRSIVLVRVLQSVMMSDNRRRHRTNTNKEHTHQLLIFMLTAATTTTTATLFLFFRRIDRIPAAVSVVVFCRPKGSVRNFVFSLSSILDTGDHRDGWKVFAVACPSRLVFVSVAFSEFLFNILLLCPLLVATVVYNNDNYRGQLS